jgi:hypothetical protein
MLLGVAGKLYEIDSYGAADSSTAGYMAIGAKVAYAAALGNLMATRRYSPRYRLRAAMRAASTVSTVVCPPWTIVHA